MSKRFIVNRRCPVSTFNIGLRDYSSLISNVPSSILIGQFLISHRVLQASLALVVFRMRCLPLSSKYAYLFCSFLHYFHIFRDIWLPFLLRFHALVSNGSGNERTRGSSNSHLCRIRSHHCNVSQGWGCFKRLKPFSWYQKTIFWCLSVHEITLRENDRVFHNLRQQIVFLHFMEAYTQLGYICLVQNRWNQAQALRNLWRWKQWKQWKQWLLLMGYTFCSFDCEHEQYIKTHRYELS